MPKCWWRGARLFPVAMFQNRFIPTSCLDSIGVTPQVGFDERHIGDQTELLVYSSAYSEDNPERRAADRRGIAQLSYAQMLGSLSRDVPSVAVCGVHGKTSTTAMIGTIVRNRGIPATVVVGSAVPSFGGSATYRGGKSYLIAETCEYRRNFLHFHPSVVVLTSVEADHLDYFRGYADVKSAFVEFVRTVAAWGITGVLHR